MRNYEWYKTRIDKQVNEFIKCNKNFNYNVYGGVTEQPLKQRLKQHIEDYKLGKSNKHITKDWKYFNNRPITQITIKKLKGNVRKYKKLIKDIENYLIKELGYYYDDRCINDKNDDGNFKQTGGFGLQLNEGDIIKIYIIYRP